MKAATMKAGCAMLAATMWLSQGAWANHYSTFKRTRIETVTIKKSPIVTTQTVTTKTTPVVAVKTLSAGDLNAIVWPVDTLKLAAMSKIESGLVDGSLTEREADELRDELGDLIQQEAKFKLASPAMAVFANANLERKYHMLDNDIDTKLTNFDTNDALPNVDRGIANLERLIVHHLAIGNLSQADAEQLFAMLNNVKDIESNLKGPIGVVAAKDQMMLRRDLVAVRYKLNFLIDKEQAAIAAAGSTY
jgi:hypothetical protein